LALTKRAREETRNKKEASLAELKLVNQQVKLREELIVAMGAQISELDKNILMTTATIQSLESDMARLRENYGRLMVATYKALYQKSPSFYLLSSKNITQAYQRSQYFKAISKMQQSQLDLLKRTKAYLTVKQIELEQSKLEKQRVADQEKVEKERLVVLKEEQKKIFSNLKEDELRLNKEIQATEAALANLKKVIKAEMDRVVTNKGKTPKTKEEADVVHKLTNSFDQNKGRFPWPIPMPNATITRHFGVQPISGTSAVLDVQGIDITTLPGQQVRAVFAGTVESVMPVPGQGKMVILSHGDYYTVYANMENVSVKAGTKIESLKPLGTARTDANSGETKMHFQLYREKIALDPETWLVRKN
jgi:septal ring factor EnvC (AmiA/AmiB activator)